MRNADPGAGPGTRHRQGHPDQRTAGPGADCQVPRSSCATNATAAVWGKRCFTKDEGRPLGVGLQEQASNHHKLRQLRVAVVSVAGKGGARLRQVRFKETNASELLMTCRKVYKRCQNREGVVGPGQGWGIPDYCPTGIRHEGGVTLIQALVRNVGTCRPDAKGEAQADSLRKSQSTDAGHRDGVARSRVEGSVMELDRRGDVVQPCCAGNPRGEDQRG